MNITLLTAASPEYWDLLTLTAPNKLEYSLRWKLQFAMRKHSEKFDPERTQFALDALKQSDWLMFMGSDTIITNHTIDVRQFLDSQYDFIISEDINGINNDVYFVQNTPGGIAFLKEVLYLNWSCKNDQECMKLVLDVMGGMQHFNYKIVHQKLFNSFKYDEYSYPSDGGGSWTPGDFVLHLPAVRNERRILLFNEYLGYVVK